MIISPRLGQIDSKYHPSWKFSMMPQNAQKDAIAVDRTTAIQPTIREAFVGEGDSMANILLTAAQRMNPAANSSLAISGLPLVALGSLAAQRSIGAICR